MWAKFFGWVRFLFDLFEDMQDLRDEQARLKNQLELLREQQEQSAQKIRDLAHGLVHLRDNDQHERDKLLLMLENELLKFERRLPPSASQ